MLYHCQAEKLEPQRLPSLDIQLCTSQKFGSTTVVLECRRPDAAKQLKARTDLFQTLGTLPLQLLQREELFPLVLTRKLDIHKDSDEGLGQVGGILVRAEHALAMEHTRDERVLCLVQVRHHSFQHFCQLGSQVGVLHPAREKEQIQYVRRLRDQGMLQELRPSLQECHPAVDCL